MLAKRNRLAMKTVANFPTKAVALSLVLFLSVLAVNFVFFQRPKTYGLMIDAGSTGSRLHTFTFARPPASDPTHLELLHEDFFPVKPGLSAYKDDVAAAGRSLEPLMERARALVPAERRKETPVFLRATAGLRMVGEEKSEEILAVVRGALRESGFRFDADDWAKVMGGSDEGVFSWITVNYLLGKENGETVGTMEMGGGSAQIAFVPEDGAEKCKDNSTEFISYKGRNIPLYTFSHLGYGLKKAKATMMNYFKENNLQSNNPCLNKGPTQKVSVPFQEDSYEMTGSGDWEQCREVVSKVMGPKISRCPCGVCSYGGALQPKPKKEYYAFAFYLERTVEIGIKSPLTLADIRKKGTEICSSSVEEIGKTYPKVYNGGADELCFDLAFIYSHLKEGHGIPDEEGDSSVKITVVDKIDGVELGWALGAMFHEMGKLAAKASKP